MKNSPNSKTLGTNLAVAKNDLSKEKIDNLERIASAF